MNIDLRGVVVVAVLMAMSAFFGLTSLVCLIAASRKGGRPRWAPRLIVSLAFGLGCLITLNTLSVRAEVAGVLDETTWYWGPPILMLWLAANHLLRRWMEPRIRRQEEAEHEAQASPGRSSAAK